MQSRSEEHTTELQSQSNLVCRLLLDTTPLDIYTLSLHDALPISNVGAITVHHVVSNELRVKTDLVGRLHLIRVKVFDDHRQRVPARKIGHVRRKFIKQGDLDAV